MYCSKCGRETHGGFCDCMIVDGEFKGEWWRDKVNKAEMVWKDIKIADVAEIYDRTLKYKEGERIDLIKFKKNDGTEVELEYTDCQERNKDYEEFFTMFVTYHNVPESYLIQSDVYAKINGATVKVGVKVQTIIRTQKYLMNYEVEQLRREGKIEDRGSRQMVYIQAFELVANKPTKELKPEYIKQLKVMGYRIPGVTDPELDESAIEWREVGGSYCEFCNETEKVKTMFIRGIEIDAHLCGNCITKELTKSINELLEEDLNEQ